MRVIAKMMLAAVALGALTTSASAAVQLVDSHAFDPAGTRLASGQVLVWNFNENFNIVKNSDFSYNGQVHIGDALNLWQHPENDNSHYGIASDVGSPHDATFSITSGHELTSLSIYLGSLDDYNTLSFLNSHGNVVGSPFTGDDLTQFAVGQDAGSTTGPNDNRRFFFTFDASDDVTAVLFHSNGRAFEFDNIAATWVSTVPEPATWAMMILGFGFIGFMMRSNRQKTAAISA